MPEEKNKLSPKSAAVLEFIAQGNTCAQVLEAYPSFTYDDIFEAAREALKAVESAGADYAAKLEEIRKKHPRAYGKWTEEEDEKLARMLQAGDSIQVIAQRLERQPNAIRSRIEKKLNILPGNATSQ